VNISKPKLRSEKFDDDDDDDDDDNNNNNNRQKCCAKGSGKEVKIQEFMFRDTTNVEPEM